MVPVKTVTTMAFSQELSASVLKIYEERRAVSGTEPDNYWDGVANGIRDIEKIRLQLMVLTAAVSVVVVLGEDSLPKNVVMLALGAATAWTLYRLYDKSSKVASSLRPFYKITWEGLEPRVAMAAGAGAAGYGAIPPGVAP